MRNIKKQIEELEQRVFYCDKDETTDAIDSLLTAARRLLSISEYSEAERLLKLADEICYEIEPDMEEEVNTTLILKLPVGKFPRHMSEPVDYKEYLEQSDHHVGEAQIIEVRQ